MEELRQGIHNYASQKFKQDVLCWADSDSFMCSIYQKVTNLAKNKKISCKIRLKYQVNDKEYSEILERMSLLVQGIATIIQMKLKK